MIELPIVRKGLLVHQLDGEVLVYDTTGDRVHLLDPTTACALAILQEGATGHADLRAEMGRRMVSAIDERVVLLAIEELHEAGLTETSSNTANSARVNRRDVVRSLAAAGFATVALPTIASLTATVGAAQGLPGQSFRRAGQACLTSGDVARCGTGLNCCAGICSPLACNGSACNVPADCASNNCCSDGFCSGTVCPAANVGQGGVCNNNGDCQPGLKCYDSPSYASNYCVTSTCREFGQTCTTSTNCCATQIPGNSGNRCPSGGPCNQ